MSNLKKRSPEDARRFLNSVFDLAFGATDGSETLSPQEVKASLKESGIDPDVAWSSASKILEAAKKRHRLNQARTQRLAHIPEREVVSTTETRESVLAEFLALFQSAGPSLQGMYARKHESASLEDLQILRDQLKLVLERERRKNEQK